MAATEQLYPFTSTLPECEITMQGTGTLTEFNDPGFVTKKPLAITMHEYPADGNHEAGVVITVCDQTRNKSGDQMLRPMYHVDGVDRNDALSRIKTLTLALHRAIVPCNPKRYSTDRFLMATFLSEHLLRVDDFS